MKDKIKHYIKEITIFFLIIIVFANVVSLYRSSNLNNNELSLSKISLIDNKTYIFSKEEPTLVHIWATWCPTCKVEASNIQTLSKNYKVLTIAVKSGSNTEIQKYLQENNYDFNVVNDSSGFLASNFNVAVFPTTFIYNKDKQLVFSDVGYTSTWGLMLRMWWASL